MMAVAAEIPMTPLAACVILWILLPEKRERKNLKKYGVFPDIISQSSARIPLSPLVMIPDRR